jgi:acyl-CoA synthetase (NDP forming)
MRGIWTEYQVRGLLEAHGIPVASAQLATGASQAAEIAATYACPVAMKIAAAGLLHKSDIGGVRLDVDPHDAAATFEDLMRTTTSAEGVLIGPMRTGGIELLVGVITDPGWGKVLSLGLGGVWVEVLGDVSLRLLPVDQNDVIEMLDELKAAPLLKGARGTRPADVQQLAEVIVRVARLAEALPLDTIEINPLRVDGSQIEILDALVVWNKENDL